MSWASAARTPGSLLAATVTPAPLPQIRTARSARPAAIASPTSLREGGIVVVGAVELGAEHDGLVAGVADHLGDVVSDDRPGVVGGNGDSQGSHSLPSSLATRPATASAVMPSSL